MPGAICDYINPATKEKCTLAIAETCSRCNGSFCHRHKGATQTINSMTVWVCQNCLRKQAQAVEILNTAANLARAEVASRAKTKEERRRTIRWVAWGIVLICITLGAVGYLVHADSLFAFGIILGVVVGGPLLAFSWPK